MKDNEQHSSPEPVETPQLGVFGVSCWAFNLNDVILVKIHDKGYQHLADKHNKYVSIVSNWEKRDAEYYKKRADENGYTKMQAWCFIEEFGDVTSIGFHGYYSTDIIIRSEHLKPCS